MPVSAATAERSFSLLKRLKTWLRNTMMQDWLIGLALMNFQSFTMKYRLILIKFYVTLIPSMTVEFCMLSTKV